MKTIKLSAPAKINLTLEVLDKRPDGYHNIKSIMQAVSLYDYLTINIEDSTQPEIILDGSSDLIPYNEKNLVHKAAVKFMDKAGITDKKISFYIEKNIPVEAGLAGGSTDAAAAFYGLNELLDKPLSCAELEELCASIGSDLNFCLHGGCALCTGRGEQIKELPPISSPVTLIKPLGFGISAKEAYTKFALLPDKTIRNYSEKLMADFTRKYMHNDLETAVIKDYKQLVEIKSKLPDSMMSGSGPTFFVLKDKCQAHFNREDFLIIEDLHFVDDGVKVV